MASELSELSSLARGLDLGASVASGGASKASAEDSLRELRSTMQASAFDLPPVDDFLTGSVLPRSSATSLQSTSPKRAPPAPAGTLNSPTPAGTPLLDSSSSYQLPNTANTKAVAKAMTALKDKVASLTAERDEFSCKLLQLQTAHDALRASFADAQAIAANDVRTAVAGMDAQNLALHKELDFVKDIAQAAESEKRAAQASVISLERQLAGMRFDAETRMHELEARATSATQAEALAQSRARELEAELGTLKAKYDEQAGQKRRVDEALRSVLAINEALLTRVSAGVISPDCL